MAAVPATALSFGFAVATRSIPTVASARLRPRRLVCRWIVDPVGGDLVCIWTSAEEPRRRPNFHLTLVPS